MISFSVIFIILFVITCLLLITRIDSVTSETNYNLIEKIYLESDFPKNFYVDSTNEIPGAFQALHDVIQHFNKITNYKFFNNPTRVKVGYFKLNGVVLQFHDSSIVDSCNSPFDGIGSVLAHAEMPPGNKICLDVAEKWNYPMLYYTIYHELMHNLGLRHSQMRNSLMYPRYSPYITGPTEFDLGNLKILYPFIQLVET